MYTSYPSSKMKASKGSLSNCMLQPFDSRIWRISIFKPFFVTATLSCCSNFKKQTNQTINQFPEKSVTLCSFVGFQIFVVCWPVYKKGRPHRGGQNIFRVLLISSIKIARLFITFTQAISITQHNIIQCSQAHPALLPYFSC